MNNQTDKPNKKPEQSKGKVDMDEFTNELAKKISRMNKDKIKKKRFLSVNPLILLVTSIVAIFVFFGLFNRNYFGDTVSLGDLIAGLEDNKYSQLMIQNDGQVVAKEKTYYVVQGEVDIEESEDKDLEVANLDDDTLQTTSFGDIEDLFEKKDLVERIRSTFGGDSSSITEILYAEDFVLVITDSETPDYILESTSQKEFESILADRDFSLGELGITTAKLRISSAEISENSLKSRVENNIISNVVVLNDLTIAKINSEDVKTLAVDWTPNIFSFADILQQEGFSLSTDEETFEVVSVNVPSGITLDTILTVLTIVGFIFLGVIIFKSAQASGMGIMQFGQSKAKMFFGKKTETSFKDVAGINEAREELNEIVDFLKSPAKYQKLGARIPKGILMVGAPGTGKTLLARAIAGEAGVPFFHTSGSEFEEMLVGAGASRVRDLFAKAKKSAPALIFIDEIDAVARQRGTRIQSGSTEQTLNQILVEMDGFEKNTNVIVIAATNRPDVLDKAILRPGRFDRQIVIEVPDKDGRFEILTIHGKNKPFAKDVDLERVAKRTVGFTGADLENILNEAAIIAAKANQKEITMDDIDEAVSKVVLGPAKRSRKRTEKELQLVAYHEAGHALVAKFTEGAIPVDKISIVSRGNSGGVTMFLPEKDENIISKTRLLADIKVSLGGRAAEEVALDDISTGASSDIEKATRVARQMIKKLGMSKTLGLVQYGQSMDSEYLGYAYGESKDYSDKTSELIDTEVREIISQLYAEAVALLNKHRPLLDKIANELLEKEVLDKEEFEAIFKDVEGK
jgi:cell division protease FtsH